MDSKNNKKVIYLGIILLIIAGIIVVALKGFNVDLMFGKHEVIEVKVGKEINLNNVKEISKDIFGNKKFEVKGLEVFNDSFQVNVESLTDEEKANFVNKINEIYGLEETVDTLNVHSVSNRRIRDSIMPYITSFAIIFIITIVYMLIRFRKLNSVKVVCDAVIKIILTEGILLSLILITRLAVSDVIINLLMIISIVELMYFLNKNERKLNDIKE